ncbi:hypothetical protein SAMN05421796_11073 [Chryseobacterium piscicola]|uniref:Uncharacterized protein n=1 Tax=Chryseobacterium piscicola TaxID=551459 RepID=A0A1N7P1F3_9FLAO|nr:hypothetical protein [Chryseobacterium piscicola]PQA92743.1 hypothetical protein B0A70_10180 [Chryseobacterium piscicola]SIT04403.1 hypothetical protein SAMN05421796_11073 [Chryseobacterium piscicola]
MNLNEYFSERTTVDIAVVKLNNQKITKSILKQINISNYIDHELDLDGKKILGLIKDNNTEWIIYTFKNKLFKQTTDFIIEVDNILLSQNTIADIANFIYGLDNYNPKQKINTISQEKLDEFKLFRVKIKDFYNLLQDRQIFI